MTGLEPISADMIDFYVGRPDVVIIDLRSEEEFTSGHIRGAVMAQSRMARRDRSRLFCIWGWAKLGSSGLFLGAILVPTPLIVTVERISLRSSRVRRIVI